MSKTFIATVLAGALALTSFTAAPARAELSDIEKFLLGAGALVIIGTAIHEADKARSKSSKKRRAVVHHAPKPKPVVRHAYKPKPLAALPSYCLRNVRSYGGDRRIFGGRCLRNNYSQFARLPERCRRVIEGPRGARVGFGPRCLRQAGFRVR